MDLNCKYTKMGGEIKNVYCKSPLTEDTFECNCSNYKICNFYYQFDENLSDEEKNSQLELACVFDTLNSDPNKRGPVHIIRNNDEGALDFCKKFEDTYGKKLDFELLKENKKWDNIYLVSYKEVN